MSAETNQSREYNIIPDGINGEVAFDLHKAGEGVVDMAAWKERKDNEAAARRAIQELTTPKVEALKPATARELMGRRATNLTLTRQKTAETGYIPPMDLKRTA